MVRPDAVEINHGLDEERAQLTLCSNHSGQMIEIEVIWSVQCEFSMADSGHVGLAQTSDPYSESGHLYRVDLKLSGQGQFVYINPHLPPPSNALLLSMTFTCFICRHIVYISRHLKVKCHLLPFVFFLFIIVLCLEQDYGEGSWT